jgi:glycosyltransferase involved in cell wall biosynthesis
VILEAMASGAPVIAAPVGGVGSHLHHHVNGLAYPPGDIKAFANAMVRLVEDDTLRRRLARGARVTAEGLSWESEMDRLDESYREVIAASARPARAVEVTA